MPRSSRIHQRNIMRLSYSILCLLALPNLSKVSAASGREGLYVGLQRYYNTFNLKYIAAQGATPYCCCGNGNHCFESLEAGNLTNQSCKTQCQLRFTLCAEGLQSGKDALIDPQGVVAGAPYCYRSEVRVSPPLVLFDQCLSSSSDNFFPDQNLALNFVFPFDSIQENDLVKLTVTIEEEDKDGFDLVDTIEVPLPTCTFSESAEHIGILGIATMHLGYSFMSVVDQSRTGDSNQACTTATTTATVTKTVQRRVTIEIVESIYPEDSGSECQETGSMSSIFTQAALPLLVIAVVLIVVTVVIIAVALFMIKRKKRAVDKCGRQDDGSWKVTYAKNEVPFSGTNQDTNISIFGNQAYQAFSFSGSQTGTAETSGFSLVPNSTYERT